MQQDNDVTFREFVHYWFSYVEKPALEVPELHEEIINFLNSSDEWDNDTAVLEVFRGADKSTLVGLFIVWKLVVNPTLTFLIFSAENNLAKKMIRDCQNIIIKHPLATHLKPKSKGKSASTSWSQRELTVRGATSGRNQSIACYGIGSQYTGARCDFVIFDDVEVKNTANTPELHESMKERIAEVDNLKTPKGKTLFIGTPWATDTIYEEKISEGNSFIKLPLLTSITGKFPAYTGISAWPDRFDEEFVKQKQSACRKNSTFLSQYQLIPEQDSECVFDVSKINEYDDEIEISSSMGRPIHKLCGKTLASVTAFWDPAMSKLRRDDSVLSVVFTTTEGDYFIHRTFGLVGEIDQQCEKVRDIALEYHLPSITIESNGVGAAFPRILRNYVSGKGIAVIDKPTTTNKMDKISSTFEIPLSAGIIYAHKSVMRGKFKIQLRKFTGKNSKSRDDYIDSVAMAMNEEPIRIALAMGIGNYQIGNWRQGSQTTEYKVDEICW